MLNLKQGTVTDATVQQWTDFWNDYAPSLFIANVNETCQKQQAYTGLL